MQGAWLIRIVALKLRDKHILNFTCEFCIMG